MIQDQAKTPQDIHGHRQAALISNRLSINKENIILHQQCIFLCMSQCVKMPDGRIPNQTLKCMPHKVCWMVIKRRINNSDNARTPRSTKVPKGKDRTDD